MFQLTKEAKLTRGLNAVGAGTSTQYSAILDMKDFDSAVAIVALGDLTASAAMEVVWQTGSVGDDSDMADVASGGVSWTAGASSEDNQLVCVELVRPRSRYCRVKVVRGSQNAVIDGIILLQCNPKSAPVTHDADTVHDTGIALSPADE